MRHDPPSQRPHLSAARPAPWFLRLLIRDDRIVHGKHMIRCTFSPQVGDTAEWTDELDELPSDGSTIEHDGLEFVVLGDPTFDESATDILAANLKVTPKPPD